MALNKISVVIHTHNEEKNIEDCIESAKSLTNKVIIIDMKSTDRTASLAQKAGAKVFTFPYSHYVEPSRGFGIKKTETDWVLVLDADERITEDLKSEILNLKWAVHEPPLYKYIAYCVPRKNIFGEIKWLKHGGWWPDYQIRLINKKYFKEWPKEIHSTPKVEGEKSYLKNPLLHYFHGDFEKMVEKTVIFENIEADLLYKEHKQVSSLTFFRKFSGELYRRLLRNFGFLDGTIGVVESIYQAFSKTITYLFLYEKSRSSL